jgi:hypothetical protein
MFNFNKLSSLNFFSIAMKPTAALAASNKRMKRFFTKGIVGEKQNDP